MADFGILILTLARRRQYFARLMRRLQPQLTSRAEVYVLEDEGAENIGQKRQRMIEAATQRYVAFIDDDDLISPRYCASILSALDEDPDVVGFRHRYYEDGKLRGHSVTSVTAKTWRTELLPSGMAKHYRTPNHLNPVRLEMAQAIGFKPMQAGEDADYSFRLLARYPQMKEVFLDETLYDYWYRTPQVRKESETLDVPDIPWVEP